MANLRRAAAGGKVPPAATAVAYQPTVNDCFSSAFELLPA